ncbi:hypothetical protein J6590_054294 [Homalodisca vitripennis]|nr:hypothetical protein J6590_096287 [Homalodisca vitripennis]KAG8306164.1 hypothetical protein J6590_054294 [Homalodisca vitripennis]
MLTEWFQTFTTDLKCISVSTNFAIKPIKLEPTKAPKQQTWSDSKPRHNDRKFQSCAAKRHRCFDISFTAIDKRISTVLHNSIITTTMGHLTPPNLAQTTASSAL